MGIIIALAWLATALLAGCSSPARDTPPVAEVDAGPLALGRAGGTAQQAGVLTGAVDQRELSLAIERYRVTKKRPGGEMRAGGADLNADGVVEALVLFSGTAWCAGEACTLVVFQKGAYGYKAVSQTDGARLPVAVGQGATAGWRDLVVAGSDGRQRRLVFAASGYPATVGAAELTVDPGQEIIGQGTVAVAAGTQPPSAQTP